MNWLISKGLTWVGKKLDGKRTYIGGFGLILSGIIGIINNMFPESVPGIDISLDAAITNIGAGCALIGIGGKIEKNTTAVKESGNVVPKVDTKPEPEPVQDGGA